eukprot:TRINITY_DN90840_c0_g1_i1.p1 TRINITY_DN90840_c0_g1~~TRINITY_DN90840_c0_g1_i1.p1  ORF type:complete len:322 (+),score=66.61 TRINITY_DN90840_c0_g1_i1:86-1051(+)
MNSFVGGSGFYEVPFQKQHLYGTSDAGLLPHERESVFLSRSQRQRINFIAAFLCTLLPWCMFLATYSVTSFYIRYVNPGRMYLGAFVLLCIVMATGWLALGAIVHKRADSHEPTWFIFLFITMVIAWSLGVAFGNINYATNMQPYYDYVSLNAYANVDPSKTQGVQIMDAGRVQFTNDTVLDLTKAAGFVNKVTYCVAPISTDKAQLGSYDFWAVGLDCCTANKADFQCGDFNDQKAHSGLRLLRDEQQAFFRLAVQEAEARHQIKATHPLFFYWGPDATGEMAWFREEGYRYFLMGMTAHFFWQLLCVGLAAHGFAKLAA